MTHRIYIKCTVCGSIILTRTQIGWLPEHPIRIHCAKCGILISGMFAQNPDVPQFNITFENATEVAMQDPDFYIEISGELLTSKIRPFKKGEDEYQLPPYMKALNSMTMPNGSDDSSEEAFAIFKRNYLQFLSFIKEDWTYIRRLHEIWLSDSHYFLSKQMRDRLPADIFPLNNDMEYLRGIHQLFLIGFSPMLPNNFFTHTTRAIWEGMSDVIKCNPSGYKALTEFFYDGGLLNEYENRSLKILNSFVDKYPFFITAIGLESYITTPDLSKEGTTTVSFEDVKHFYLECFEAIGEMIALVVAHNNLKYRNDPFIMADSSFKTVKTLQDFIDMRNKGNKITFCTTAEIFNDIIDLETDNGLRNAIGHESYSYDGVNQIISFYSSGKAGKGDQEKVYLLEFIQKALSQFYTLIALIELIYQSRKFYYVQHGFIPIKSDDFNNRKKKIGRNDPCPCGSGKKHKKCCGFNI